MYAQTSNTKVMNKEEPNYQSLILGLIVRKFESQLERQKKWIHPN